MPVALSRWRDRAQTEPTPQSVRGRPERESPKALLQLNATGIASFYNCTIETMPAMRPPSPAPGKSLQSLEPCPERGRSWTAKSGAPRSGTFDGRASPLARRGGARRGADTANDHRTSRGSFGHG